MYCIASSSKDILAEVVRIYDIPSRASVVLLDPNALGISAPHRAAIFSTGQRPPHIIYYDLLVIYHGLLVIYDRLLVIYYGAGGRGRVNRAARPTRARHLCPAPRRHVFYR